MDELILGRIEESRGWIYQQIKVNTGGKCMHYCEECGRNITELHHIVFRSQAAYMKNIKINFKYLCPECHRGNNGPHMNKKKNIQYKMELQKKLFKLFGDKEYFTEKEIQNRLETTASEVGKITKKLKVYKEGYEKVELIARLMGGMLYAN